MGFWMELRCESRTDAVLDTDPAQQCWSHVNQGPMQEASDSQASVLSAYRDLAAEARSTGWKRTRQGWICPFCAKVTATRDSAEGT